MTEVKHLNANSWKWDFKSVIGTQETLHGLILDDYDDSRGDDGDDARGADDDDAGDDDNEVYTSHSHTYDNWANDLLCKSTFIV
jgi:hypothetical protein